MPNIMPICPRCGRPAIFGDNFCGNCGANLDRTSPRPHDSVKVRGTLAHNISSSIVRLTHSRFGLFTIVRTIRQSVEARERAQRRTILLLYVLVSILFGTTLAVLITEARIHGMFH